jgi:hypothetical protein
MAYIYGVITLSHGRSSFIFINAVNAVRGGGGPYWRTDPIKSNISKVVNEKDLETLLKLYAMLMAKISQIKKKKKSKLTLDDITVKKYMMRFRLSLKIKKFNGCNEYNRIRRKVMNEI